MSKNKTSYQCSNCSKTYSQWAGQCGECRQWNTVDEIQVNVAGNRYAVSSSSYKGLAQNSPVLSLSEIDAVDVPRFSSGMDEFDRVLGGGLVVGSISLLSGDPGIGKSTLLLQVLSAVQKTKSTLYVSGEESGAQIAMRAKRLRVDCGNLKLQAEINLEKILGTISNLKPDILVIDSIQTMYSENVTSAPGSVSQVRECAAQLTRVAKQDGVTIILVGHVTKEGVLAGPRVLEHIVDAVMFFEGDGASNFRIVRAIKNRFGAVNEIGVFAMTEKGLAGVSNPSALFLTQRDKSVPGSCVMVTQEGTRPLLVEIQALVDTSHLPNPRRLSVGLEQNRLAMLLAVGHKHGGISAFDQDVYLNAVGGVKITEPAADLAVLIAIHSSMKNRPVPRDLVVFGEVGLAGEIRPAPRGQERLREAVKLGFTKAIIPKANLPKVKIPGLECIGVDRVSDVLSKLRELE